MVCSNCASTNTILVQGQAFCVNCGHPVGVQPASAAQAAKVAQSKINVAVAALKPKANSRPKTDSITPPKPKGSTEISHFGAKNPLTQTGPTAADQVRKPRATSQGRHQHQPAPAPKALPQGQRPKPPPQSRTVQASIISQPVERVPRRASGPARLFKGGVIAVVVALSATFYVLIKALEQTGALTLPGLSSYLALRPLHTRELILALLPAMVILIGGILLLICWLAATQLWSWSRALDHRQAPLKLARLAGWNAAGGLLGLVLSWLLMSIGLAIGLMLALRQLVSLNLSPLISSSIGVAITFMLVIVWLWVSSGWALAICMHALTAKGWAKSLAGGLALAKSFYVLSAGTWLWLFLVSGLIKAGAVAGSWWLVTHTAGQERSLVTVGLCLTLGLTLTGLIWFGVWIWILRYRRLTLAAYGPGELANYRAGRKPSPVSKLGAALTTSWWLLVAIGGAYLLLRLHLDPKPVLDKLSQI